MEYRALGRSGMFVSQLALGGMMFGSFGNTDHEESIRIVHRALDAGITHRHLRMATPAASRRRSSGKP